MIKTPLGDIITVPDSPGWSMDGRGCLYVGDGWRFVLDDGEWATVITPAPEDQPQGLVDGMACEPDEHMRKAIVEKAREFGNNGPRQYMDRYLIWREEGMLWQASSSPIDGKVITPGEFYDRLCKTMTPEPPLFIGDQPVNFYKGNIKVGNIDISNEVVRKIAERLKEK